MNILTRALVALLLLTLTPALSAMDDEEMGARVASCRLAYDYTARDGFLICASGSRYRTYFPHWSARRARRLPAGAVLTVEFVSGAGCGSGCWTRVLRIERQ